MSSLGTMRFCGILIFRNMDRWVISLQFGLLFLVLFLVPFCWHIFQFLLLRLKGQGIIYQCNLFYVLEVLLRSCLLQHFCHFEVSLMQLAFFIFIFHYCGFYKWKHCFEFECYRIFFEIIGNSFFHLHYITF